MNLQDLLDSAVHVVFAWRLRVECLDGECSTGNGEGWCIAEEFGKLVPSIRDESNGDRIWITFSAFIVAEVTINFRSRLRDKTLK